MDFTDQAGGATSASSSLLQELEGGGPMNNATSPPGHPAQNPDLAGGFDLSAYTDQSEVSLPLGEMPCDLPPTFGTLDVGATNPSVLNVAGLMQSTTGNTEGFPLMRPSLPMPIASPYVLQKPWMEPPGSDHLLKSIETSRFGNFSNPVPGLPQTNQPYLGIPGQGMDVLGASLSNHPVPMLGPSLGNMNSADANHAMRNLASTTFSHAMATSAMATKSHQSDISTCSNHSNRGMLVTTAASQNGHRSGHHPPGAIPLMLNPNEAAGRRSSADSSQTMATNTVSMPTTASTVSIPPDLSNQILPSIGSIMTTSPNPNDGNKGPPTMVQSTAGMTPANLRLALSELSSLTPPPGFSLPHLPVSIGGKPVTSTSLSKAQELMIYHDKVTGKKFLIPVGPAKSDGQRIPGVDGGAGPPLPIPGPWRQGNYEVSDVSLSKFLNLQYQPLPDQPAGAAITSSSTVTSISTAKEAMSQNTSQTKTKKKKQRSTRSKGGAGIAQANLKASFENPNPNPSGEDSATQESVNILKSHLLKALVPEGESKAAEQNQVEGGMGIGDKTVDGSTEGAPREQRDNPGTSTQTDMGLGNIQGGAPTNIPLPEGLPNKEFFLNKEIKEEAVDMDENCEMKPGEGGLTAGSPLKEDSTATSRYAALVAAMNIQKMVASGMVTTPSKVDVSVHVDDTQCVIEDGKRWWKCLLCPKKYTSKHNLIQHILSHTEVKPHACLICSKPFRQQSHLHTHMLTHTNIKPFSCTKCGRGFTQASHLKRHMATHMQQRPYMCTLCGRGFVFPSELKLHVDRHKNGQDNTCDQCSQTFDTVRKLKSHKVTVHRDSKTLTCLLCGKAFAFPSQMRDHMMKHEGKRPYVCSDCGMAFMKEHHLKAHQFTHTGLRPYSCNICDRAFNQRANLQRHQLIHSAERKYKCEICERSFTQPQVLKSHMITHAEQKPYECRYCGKRFSRAHNLQGHEHTHKGGKPHTCFCGSSFTLRGNLNRHKKVKHGLDVSAECTEEEAAQILNELSSKPRIADEEPRDPNYPEGNLCGKKKRKSLPRKNIPVGGEGNSEMQTVWPGEGMSGGEGSGNEEGDTGTSAAAAAAAATNGYTDANATKQDPVVEPGQAPVFPQATESTEGNSTTAATHLALKQEDPSAQPVVVSNFFQPDPNSALDKPGWLDRKAY